MSWSLEFIKVIDEEKLKLKKEKEKLKTESKKIAETKKKLQIQKKDMAVAICTQINEPQYKPGTVPVLQRV